MVRTVRKINQQQLLLFTRFWALNSSFANGNGNNRAIQDTNGRPVYLIENKDDSKIVENEDWVWPVLIVMILLLGASITTTVIMTVCYCKNKGTTIKLNF